MSLLPDCREASALVSRSLDGDLPWSQRAALRLHLAMCGACRNFATQAAFIRTAARRLAARVERGSGSPPP